MSSRSRAFLRIGVFVKESPLGGRGVFAARSFRKGQLLERCPYLRLYERDVQGRLYDYVFDDKRGQVLLPLGFGALYNHSPEPNVDYLDDAEDHVFEFVALRNIAAGEELCIDYGHDFWSSRVIEPRVRAAAQNGGAHSHSVGPARRRPPGPARTRTGTRSARRG